MADTDNLPFPDGWYFIETQDEIRNKTLIQKTWLGEEIVMWNDDAGKVCVAKAHCPHMGSYLGPEIGGKVRNGNLVCPFHGFEYDTSGRCVATPNAPPPKTAHLQLIEINTINDLVLGWWSNSCQSSTWTVPEAPSGGSVWSKYYIHRFHTNGARPQDTTENSVDINHLSHVHGYCDVVPIGEISIEGPHLQSAFDFKRRLIPVLGSQSIVFDVSAIAHLWGLGISYIEIHERTIGMDIQFWVLATPVDDQRMDITLYSRLREISHPQNFFIGLGFLPRSLRTKIMGQFIISKQVQDVEQDIPIWERKCIPPRPVLCRTDGGIMKFRRFCDQFYPQNEKGTDITILRSKLTES